MFFPTILIIVGMLIILEKAGVITGDFWGYVWGAAIVLLGLSFFMKKGKHGHWCCGGEK